MDIVGNIAIGVNEKVWVRKGRGDFEMDLSIPKNAIKQLKGELPRNILPLSQR